MQHSTWIDDSKELQRMLDYHRNNIGKVFDMETIKPYFLTKQRETIDKKSIEKETLMFIGNQKV